MNATNCIGGQNKIRYLYSVFVILYAVRGVKGLIKNFELRIDSIECAGPAVVEGEGLGEGLANDVACLVRIEEFRVKRYDLNCEGGALGRELGIEGFQMKEDCLFGLEHLFCALAGNRNENEMFLVHDNTMFKNLTTTLTTSSAGEQHTPGSSRELVVKTIQVNWVVN